MDVAALLSRIESRADYAGQIQHVEVLPERPGRFADPDGRCLRRCNDCWPAAASSSSTRTKWPPSKRPAPARTSSSSPARPAAKRCATTCRFSKRRSPIRTPRALYLFPTKALAQDQLKGLLELVGGDPELAAAIRPGVYDGDTPTAQRRRIRGEANLVLSNPDMLHAAVLPYHPEMGGVLCRSAVTSSSTRSTRIAEFSAPMCRPCCGG